MNSIDWLEVVSTIATVAAAGLAAWTIRQSKKQAKESQDALIAERRIDFELGVLADLAELVEKRWLSDDGSRRLRIRTVAQMLPAETIPLTRAAAGLPTTDEAKAVADERRKVAGFSDAHLLNDMKDELLEEIFRGVQENLEHRNPPVRRRSRLPRRRTS